jgi:hypothetical protein
LGSICFRDNQIEEALKWTEHAFQACINTSDEEGVRTYRQSLQTLSALHEDRQNPGMRERILACREHIVSAQNLSDLGNYEASNATLLGLLSTIGHPPAAEFTDYLAKACGLLGWNHHYLKDPGKALQFTERALACCRATSDNDGVRVYEANLRAIRSSEMGSQG